MNIVDPILAQCRYQPGAVALCVPGAPNALITYAQLQHLIHNIARRALQVGLKRGDTVALLIDDPIGHAMLILGLTKAGVIGVSVRSAELPKELKIDAIIVAPGMAIPGGMRFLQADSSWTDGDGRPPDKSDQPTNWDDACRIVLTSGTTGEAKAIGFTHRMVSERAARFDYLAGNALAANLRAYGDLGFSTSLGYLFLVHTLTRGGLLVLPGEHYQPAFDACELYGVNAWIGSPANLVKVVEYFENSHGRRCNLQVMLCGGSLLSKSLSERARGRICTNLVSAYGSTETNMVATAPAHITAQTPGAVGYLTPGMAVETVDESGRPLAAGSEGLIRIRGPFNVNEYVGDPGESAKAFRDGWFYPGDIGRVTSDDLLVITGRQKTVMNIGGEKVRPEIIEDMLTSLAEIEQAGVISVLNDVGIEEIWAAIVLRAPLNERQLFVHCQERLAPSFVPRRFVRVDEVPRNPMGKVDRTRLAQLLQKQGNSPVAIGASAQDPSPVS
jgi:acyl-CoA synthetase (AMP-forming)/AMP-acid ligase II